MQPPFQNVNATCQQMVVHCLLEVVVLQPMEVPIPRYGRIYSLMSSPPQNNK